MRKIDLEVGLVRVTDSGGMYGDSKFTEDEEGGDHLTINLYDLIEQVVRATPEENIDKLVEALGVTEKVRKFMVRRLIKEYSRPCYYETVHIDRAEFLDGINKQEVAFYAYAIAEAISDEIRWKDACQILEDYCRRHHCFDHCREKEPPPLWPAPIDWDVRRAIEAEITELLTGLIPAPAEEGVTRG